MGRASTLQLAVRSGIRINRQKGYSLVRDNFNLWWCGNSLSGSSALHWWGNNHCSFICCVLGWWSLSGAELLIGNVCVSPQVSASCPKDCHCPLEVPTCAARVSLMLDGCGCCRACVRQLFEDCSTSQPCDHTKGLECNFGGGYDSAKGICRGLFPLSMSFSNNSLNLNVLFQDSLLLFRSNS